MRGEPGVGKTALLSDLGERTGDATVLWTAGIESESPLAFAALHRLLRPLLGRLDDIPHVQAHALRRAYGEFLRRNRRRIDARTHLGTALRVFTELRSEPCAERERQ